MRTSQPGPEGRTAPAGWQRWLLPLGGIGVILALLALPHGGPQGMVLSYSRFLSDIGAGAVRAVTIDPAGQVAGSLATGQPFAATIPIALDDRSLARLAAHHVQVTATAAMPSSPWSGLLGFLPLLLLGGFILFAVRSARRARQPGRARRDGQRDQGKDAGHRR